jgi:drug/metabolite transporter (DMT)-like permease
MDLRIKLFCVLFLVQLVFSLWPSLVQKSLSSGTNVFTLGLYRDVIASCFLWLSVTSIEGVTEAGEGNLSPSQKTSIFNMTSKEKSLFMVLGVCSFVNSVGYLFALLYVTPFNSALLHPAVPVFASTLGAYLGVNKLTLLKVIATGICVVGSIGVVLANVSSDSNGPVNKSSPSLVGNILLVLQSFAMAGLLVGQKFVPQKYSPLKTTALYYTFGTFLSIPISIICIISTNSYASFSEINWIILLTVLFGGLFVITFNYIGLTWASKISSPAIPASSMMLQPPLTYVVSSYVIQTSTSSNNVAIIQLIGCIVIVFGLILGICEEFPKSSSSVSENDFHCKTTVTVEDTRNQVFYNGLTKGLHSRSRSNDDDDDDDDDDDEEQEIVFDSERQPLCKSYK